MSCNVKKINFPIIILPDVMKNWLESPCMPIVPGPVLSANTLIKENAPLIMPKPRPETVMGNDAINLYILVALCFYKHLQ